MRGGSASDAPLDEAFIQKTLSQLSQIFPSAKEEFLRAVPGMHWPANPYSKGAYIAEFSPGYWPSFERKPRLQYGKLFFSVRRFPKK